MALNCYICRLAGAAGRQQPSHLGVINPYSALAAFLPFTTDCLKLKRGGERRGRRGRAVKKKKKLRRRDRESEGKRAEDEMGQVLSFTAVRQPADRAEHDNINNTSTGAFPKINHAASLTELWRKTRNERRERGPPSTRTAVPLADQAERRDYETPTMPGLVVVVGGRGG